MTNRQILDELRQPTRALAEHIPDVFEGYRHMSSAVFRDGALDAKTNVIDGLTLYGSMLVDDFQFEREEGYPDKLAFDAGFRWVPARPLGLAIQGHYRRVDIYTYSHVDSLSTYVSGAGEIGNGDVLLGGAPAPDADSWRLDAEVFPRANIAVAAGVFKHMEADVVRGNILKTGKRIDGRDTKTVRPIEIEVGVLPRAHG